MLYHWHEITTIYHIDLSNQSSGSGISSGVTYGHCRLPTRSQRIALCVLAMDCILPAEGHAVISLAAFDSLGGLAHNANCLSVNGLHMEETV